LYRLFQVTVLAMVTADLYHLGKVMPFRWSSSLSGGGVPSLVFGGVVRGAKGWQVTIDHVEDGTYEITLTGLQGDELFIRYRPVDEFDERMFLIFLRHIWTPEDTPARPFLRQEWLAEAFDTHQELISRWLGYRRDADWRRLMSRRHGSLLSLDQIQQIVNVWACNFWWSVEEVQAHLARQGGGNPRLEYSHNQIEEAGRLSGFLQVRRRLRERFHLGAEAVKPRDGWLVQRLFDQISILLNKVEMGEGLTPEEGLEIGILQAQRKDLGLARGTELEKPLPWLYQVQQVLFGWWEDVEGDSIHCIYCGSTQVASKSREPRYKKYYDRGGKLREVAVYRYYCKNTVCSCKTFTNLPSGLVPYSRHSLDVHLLAVQGYAWGRSAYRLVGQAVGVSAATAYRWVSMWGEDLLPLADLFGVVCCSGVIGVDEKWVKVPKNDKPEGKHKKWMYVYLAVDVYTYDLLHIAIFPYLGKDSARAFLLELKAKGYKPRIIVTDLNRDYGEPVAEVFPKATHHECIFHAMKWTQRQIKEVYGADYAEKHPEAVRLKKDIYRIFQCKDKRTALRRYDKVMALRDEYVAAMPEAAKIFNSLKQHWPKLVNGVGSKVIPKTNNAVELVIRRFDQHYQNFCGFESIETARRFLAVFEMVYRFTPFAKDNKKDKERPPDQRIGGKCPLELAGYEVLKLPIAQICRGQLLGWPTEAWKEIVPNV
jgi:transposase-like protein